MAKPVSLRRHVSSALRVLPARDAVAAVEFALVISFLVPLAVGVCGLGMLLFDQIAITNAAWSGASQASLHGWTSNSPTDIQNAVLNASGYLPGTVSVVQQYGCDDSGTIQSADPSVKCANGLAPGKFVFVTAQSTVQLPVPIPGYGSSYALSSTAIARIQ